MIKPAARSADVFHAYQKAMEDFGITALLNRLKNFSDANLDAAWMNINEQEAESLAVILTLFCHSPKNFAISEF